MAQSSIVVRRQDAALAQIHSAIEHAYKSNFVCAITLAGAAEGALPATNKPTLRAKIQALKKRLFGEAEFDPNSIRNWLKHGGASDSKTITELDVITEIQRAISKFIAIYDAQSPPMKKFGDWALSRIRS